MLKAELKDASLNRYGYLKNSIYYDGGQFLSVKDVPSSTTIIFQETIKDLANGM